VRFNSGDTPGPFVAPGTDATVPGGRNFYVQAFVEGDGAGSSGQFHAFAAALLITSDRVMYYQLNTIPLAQIEDRSANTNTGDFSWPVISLGPDITSVVGALKANVPPPDLVASLGGGAVATAGSITTMFGGETGDQLGEIFGLVNFAATQGNLPIGTLWLAIGGIVVIVAGASTYMAFKNLIYAAVTMGFVILFFSLIGVGMFPFWLVIIFGILAAGIVLLIKNGLAA